MFIVAIVGIFFGLLFYVGCYRTEQVHNFAMRLVDEEGEWRSTHAVTHWQQLEGKDFLRFNSLPSENKMILRFWLPLSYWERRLKPFGEYHGINKGE